MRPLRARRMAAPIAGALAAGVLLAGAPSLLQAACPPGAVAQPASFDSIIRPAMAEDVNPATDVVEVELTAREEVWDFDLGNTTPVYTYNGVIPGPTIEAEVGDLLVVRFCNDLPEETTIHWHGVETPANMDGSNISQLTVPPGGTFRYEFPLLKAGMFWYHPHVRTNEQVEKGLYGVLLVRDPAEDASLGLPTREHIFVLDDIELDEDGQIPPFFTGSKEAVALEQLNGREGKNQLLNGVFRPRLRIKGNVPHRLRILNAANVRFMRMSIPDHVFWRIGGDQGLLEAPIEIQPAVTLREDCPEKPASPAFDPEGAADDAEPRHPSDPDPTTGLILTPGERADVVFEPRGGKGDCYPFQWHDMQRGRHSVEFLPDRTVRLAHEIPDGTRQVRNFAWVDFAGTSPPTNYTPPAELATLTPIDPTGAPPLPLVMGHTLPDWDTGEVVFFVQDVGKPFAALTPRDVHTVRLGDTYVWEVKNLTGSHHNFHTHGWGFQHIETEFVDLDFPGDPTRNYVEPASHLENKDTILIKRRPGTVRGRSFSITRLAVTFDTAGREGLLTASSKVATADRSGGWLLHCHLLEHSALGMMSFFQTSHIFSDGFESGDLSSWAFVSP